jgi:hypothetical protein|nr:MAG TPA: hypothetical protein [Caudoviricetes sp.]
MKSARPSDILAAFRRIEERETDELWEALTAAIERAKDNGCCKIELDWTIARHPEDTVLTCSGPEGSVMRVKIYNSRAYNHDTIFDRLMKTSFGSLRIGDHPDLYWVIKHIDWS